MARQPFVMFPRELLYSGLPAAAQLLWCVLDDVARTRHLVAVDQASLGRVLGVNDRSVRRLAALLGDAGWLRTHRAGRVLSYEPLRRARPVDNASATAAIYDRCATPDTGDFSPVSLGSHSPTAREEEEPQSSPRRPTWCGRCAPATRLLENLDGLPSRCPSCHPLVAPRF